ncbi:MAG: hypothetical protein ABIX28_08270 [Vicinamibacterales bacterium]
MTDARAQVELLTQQLAAAEGRLRVDALLGDLLRLSDAVDAKNYGEAAALSSAFFDRVRREVALPHTAEVSEALNGILSSRDPVTTAIAATDPSLSESLKAHERTLRAALGFPLSGA